METSPVSEYSLPSETLDDATATALLGEQERAMKQVLSSNIWRQHETLHEARGDEAMFLFAPTPDQLSTINDQPSTQEPLYKEGTFPVGGCSCGFNVNSDDEGTLTGTNGTNGTNGTQSFGNQTIKISYTTPDDKYSNSSTMYGTMTTTTMYK